MKTNKNTKSAIYTSIFILTLLLPNLSFAHHSCESYTQKIEKIKAKMRHGYTIEQGEKLKKKLTKWQNKRVECEKSSHWYRQFKP